VEVPGLVGHFLLLPLIPRGAGCAIALTP
jgi:hypothetical protein